MFLVLFFPGITSSQFPSRFKEMARCPGTTADEAADTWSVAAIAGKVDLSVGESTQLSTAG